jgi:hypothetical protein
LRTFLRTAFAPTAILISILVLNLIQYPRWLPQADGYKLPTPLFKFPSRNPYDHVDSRLPSVIEFKKAFTGWNLIGFDPAAVSLVPPSRFKSGYLGAASTQITAYDPTLTDQELASLAGAIGPSFASRRKWFAVIVPPPPGPLPNATVIVLRDRTGKLFFTPLFMAPKRFQALRRAE